jgi:hypothetical protein
MMTHRPARIRILRPKWLIAMVALTCMAVTACGPSTNNNETRDTIGGGKIYPTYRYRLTVEVDTPEGLKTGSSVIEVATSKGGDYAIPSPRALSYKVHGEAVTVDLGKRGLMFALLRSERLNDWAAAGLELVAPPTPDSVETDDEYGYRRARALALVGPQLLPRNEDAKGNPSFERSAPPTAYPMLVRFGDITNPRTVAKVDPDALGKSFGKGVTLRKITVERTEDAVTSGIEKRLAWLPSQSGSLVKYPSMTPIGEIPSEQMVNEGDFQRGGSR